MRKRSVRLLRQLHGIYGDRIDSVIGTGINSPIYSRTCHTNDILQLRKRWSRRTKD